MGIGMGTMIGQPSRLWDKRRTGRVKQTGKILGTTVRRHQEQPFVIQLDQIRTFDIHDLPVRMGEKHAAILPLRISRVQ